MKINARYSQVGILFLGLFIGLGLLGAGYFIAASIRATRPAEHFITVKGLAERQVKANLAAWEIDFRETDNDLVSANKRIESDQQQVIAFLKNSGFNEAEIELRATKVTDIYANPYNSNTNPAKYRYIVTSGVRVRTAQVDLVQKVSQTTSNLIKAGIPLSFDTSDYSNDLIPNPSYYYTQLDQIRPELLSEATKSAYLVASQFVSDAQTHLGGIRRASQGVFQIISRDATETDSSHNQASSIYKKIRLVTTIDFVIH